MSLFINKITIRCFGKLTKQSFSQIFLGKMGKVLLCIFYVVNKEAPRDIIDDVQDILDEWVSFIWRLCNKSSRNHSNNNWDVVRGYSAKLRASEFDIFEDHLFAQVSSDKMWRELPTMNYQL